MTILEVVVVYRAHIFTSSGSFNVSAVEDGDVDYLVVAGGGGGGDGWYGGGGGGGGLVSVRTNVAGHTLASKNFRFHCSDRIMT